MDYISSHLTADTPSKNNPQITSRSSVLFARTPTTSLTFRISFFIIFTMVISLLLFSLVFVISERDKVLDNIVKSGEVFANFSNKSIFDNYVQFYTHPNSEDFDVFKKNLQSILKNNTDVIGVSLIGKNGRILFDIDELTTGKYTGVDRTVADKITMQMLNKEDVTSRTIKLSNGQEATEIIVPLREKAGGHLFSIQYLISNQSLSDRMREVYLNIFYVVMPLIVVVILAVISFTRKLVNPIKSLTDVVESLREGNMDARSDIKANDEIGTLAQVFNQMADKLVSYNKELENQVKERTIQLDTKVNELERMNKFMTGRELKMIELKNRIDELERTIDNKTPQT